jgi:TRAP-type C4-dicarboxylate transport system permease small subunit
VIALLERLGQLLDRLQAWMLAASAVLLVGTAVLMNVEIISRTLFSRSTQISDEYAGYFFGALSVLCMVAALRSDRFLRVDGLIMRLPAMAQALLEGAGALIGAGVSAVLTWMTAKLALASWTIGSVSLQISQTPLWIPQAVLPLGFGILTISFIEFGLRRALALATGRTTLAKQQEHL